MILLNKFIDKIIKETKKAICYSEKQSMHIRANVVCVYKKEKEL